MTLSITIPDDISTRVVDALCGLYGYNPASGLTRNQFAKQVVITFVKDSVKDYEGRAAMQQARDSTINDVNTKIQIS